MTTLILYNGDARRKLRSGLDVHAIFIGTNYDPWDSNVIIAEKFGKPIFTMDEVAVAKKISLRRKFEILYKD